MTTDFSFLGKISYQVLPSAKATKLCHHELVGTFSFVHDEFTERKINKQLKSNYLTRAWSILTASNAFSDNSLANQKAKVWKIKDFYSYWMKKALFSWENNIDKQRQYLHSVNYSHHSRQSYDNSFTVKHNNSWIKDIMLSRPWWYMQ